MVKHNFDLLNNIHEKKDVLKIKENIENILINEYELAKISSSSPNHTAIICSVLNQIVPTYRTLIKNTGTNLFYFNKKKGCNVKNDKDLNNIISNQLKSIKNYLFNDKR